MFRKAFGSLAAVCGCLCIVGAVEAAATVNGVTLNGGANPVIVLPNTAITATVSVTNGNGANNHWGSTQYTISGSSAVCVNVPNPDFTTNSGSTTRDVVFNAPATPGTYSISWRVFTGDVCGANGSNTVTLTDRIVVCLDGDSDGVLDCVDNCPDDANADQADDDDDGVGDVCDACADTPMGEGVNADGCSCSQIASCDDMDPCTLDGCVDGTCTNDVQDADGDGVCDADDDCADTPMGETVNADGCSCSQLDCDDGNSCTLDTCLDGVCSNDFQDGDGDGVCDADDICEGHDDADDADNDGIPDGCDDCPLDDENDADSDGVCGDIDECPGTLVGESVNAVGCSCSQLDCDDSDPCTADSCLDGVCSNVFQDADGDGVCDADDDCADTPMGETVGPEGCSCSQLDCDDGDDCTLDGCADGVCSNVFQDDDGDGVCDADDTCADTPGGETPNAEGCSCSQVDCDDADPCTLDTCEDGVCSNVFQDADGDGVCDADDICPGSDDNADADGDGTPDGCDGCPDDADKTAAGVCGCGTPDIDSDGDGTLNCNDGCPNDPNKVAPGACGCGEADTDADGNGVADCLEDDDNGNDNGNDNEPAPQPTPEACGIMCAPGMGAVMPLVALGLIGMRRLNRRRRAR